MVAASKTSAPGRRLVAIWIFVCCIMVVAMVVLGGLTRLTHSGLSMVEWQPLTILPPLSDVDWEIAFSKYRESPEFKEVNPDMKLTGFKGIFWLEYVHRLWGRSIGLVFAVPFVLFLIAGRIEAKLARRLGGIFLLGGAQGLMGWLMVKSGLVDQPDVSHYRLAAHLMLAFVILGALLWTGLGMLPGRSAPPGARRLFPWALALVVLVMVTASWGAFVAGLDAGLMYNTFPLMNGQLLPDYAFDQNPLAANFVANPGTVQFTHRLLAVSTLLLATILWLKGRRLGIGPLLTATVLWAWGQAGLGIATLLFQVPVALGSLHQAGAVLLFALALSLMHSLRSESLDIKKTKTSMEERDDDSVGGAAASGAQMGCR